MYSQTYTEKVAEEDTHGRHIVRVMSVDGEVNYTSQHVGEKKARQSITIHWSRQARLHSTPRILV